jgi:uncharacterized membrane-anchored protein
MIETKIQFIVILSVFATLYFYQHHDDKKNNVKRIKLLDVLKLPVLICLLVFFFMNTTMCQFYDLNIDNSAHDILTEMPNF